MSDGDGTALYLHIPFCDRRCPYCHFYCFVNRDPALPLRYVQALAREFGLYAPHFPREISSVYVGGGTPTALTTSARRFLCSWLRGELREVLRPGAEITLEVNPESASVETLDRWVEAGVNRISLGVQSMDPVVLRFLGRLNTPSSNRRALQLACERVENVSIDLILATPAGQSMDAASSLNLVQEFPVTHVSAYLLEIHPTTRFGRDVARGRWTPRGDEEQAAIYLEAVESLREAGFTPYELSNFARRGLRSFHNQSYWSGRSYLGLGASAHSFHRARRWWNRSDAQAWCQAVESGRRGIEGEEEIDAVRARDEELLLGLRTSEGLDPSWLLGRESLWQHWVRAGYAEIEDARPRLTPSGWLVMDEIARVLASSAASGLDRAPRSHSPGEAVSPT
jgi:oxygen-independent coproporphyrinogen-3 oxidase